MLFNSFRFLLLFFPAVLFVAWFLRGRPLLAWITIASYSFYAMAGEVWFLIPMTATIVLDYFLALRLEQTASQTGRRCILGLSLCGNLGLLIYFKYARLILRSGLFILNGIGLLRMIPAWASAFDVLLPAGISFYTFQTLSYMLDVYKRQAPAEHDFWRFAAFVSFFPHLVAGPLTRHHQLIPGLSRIAERGVKPRWSEGVFLFSIGLCRKVLIADRLGNWVDPMLMDIGHLGFTGAWLALGGYAIQIYFDFCGYSEMAIGLGRLFGIELPLNFDRPYTALNPSDFWNRWHITLSRWLRDYLYFPLGGNRCTPPRQLANLMITMFLGGLWHGAQWTFAAWGLYHGVLLVIYHLTKAQWDRCSAQGQRALTMFLICFGWVFFRAGSWHDAYQWMSQLIGCGGMGTVGVDAAFMAIWIIFGFAMDYAFPTPTRQPGFHGWRTGSQVGLGTATVIAILFMNYSSKFLYFQF